MESQEVIAELELIEKYVQAHPEGIGVDVNSEEYAKYYAAMCFFTFEHQIVDGSPLWTRYQKVLEWGLSFGDELPGG
jgi:hypothetical protein